MADYISNHTGQQMDTSVNMSHDHVNKDFLDTVEDAPKDGIQYVRQNGEWVEVSTIQTDAVTVKEPVATYDDLPLESLESNDEGDYRETLDTGIWYLFCIDDITNTGKWVPTGGLTNLEEYDKSVVIDAKIEEAIDNIPPIDTSKFVTLDTEQEIVVKKTFNAPVLVMNEPINSNDVTNKEYVDNQTTYDFIQPTKLTSLSDLKVGDDIAGKRIYLDTDIVFSSAIMSVNIICNQGGFTQSGGNWIFYVAGSPRTLISGSNMKAVLPELSLGGVDFIITSIDLGSNPDDPAITNGNLIGINLEPTDHSYDGLKDIKVTYDELNDTRNELQEDVEAINERIDNIPTVDTNKFVTIDTMQNVSGNKAFTSSVSFNKLTTLGMGGQYTIGSESQRFTEGYFNRLDVSHYPTDDSDVATKEYVDANSGGDLSNVVTLNENQVITGEKEFSTSLSARYVMPTSNGGSIGEVGSEMPYGHFNHLQVLNEPAENNDVINKRYADLFSAKYLPNYGAQETINHMSADNPTWVSDKDGYVYIKALVTNILGRIILTINGKEVGYNLETLAGVYPIFIGDSLVISCEDDVFEWCYCYYIPPYIIKTLTDNDMQNVVTLNGTQDIVGSKTFTSEVSLDYEPTVYKSAVNKGYVDNKTIYDFVQQPDLVSLSELKVGDDLSGKTIVCNINTVFSDAIKSVRINFVDGGLFTYDNNYWAHNYGGSVARLIDYNTMKAINVVYSFGQYSTITSIDLGTNPTDIAITDSSIIGFKFEEPNSTYNGVKDLSTTYNELNEVRQRLDVIEDLVNAGEKVDWDNMIMIADQTTITQSVEGQQQYVIPRGSQTGLLAWGAITAPNKGYIFIALQYSCSRHDASAWLRIQPHVNSIPFGYCGIPNGYDITNPASTQNRGFLNIGPIKLNAGDTFHIYGGDNSDVEWVCQRADVLFVPIVGNTINSNEESIFIETDPVAMPALQLHRDTDRFRWQDAYDGEYNSIIRDAKAEGLKPYMFGTVDIRPAPKTPTTINDEAGGVVGITMTNTNGVYCTVNITGTQDVEYSSDGLTDNVSVIKYFWLYPGDTITTTNAYRYRYTPFTYDSDSAMYILRKQLEQTQNELAELKASVEGKTLDTENVVNIEGIQPYTVSETLGGVIKYTGMNVLLTTWALQVNGMAVRNGSLLGLGTEQGEYAVKDGDVISSIGMTVLTFTPYKLG